MNVFCNIILFIGQKNDSCFYGNHLLNDFICIIELNLTLVLILHDTFQKTKTHGAETYKKHIRSCTKYYQTIYKYKWVCLYSFFFLCNQLYNFCYLMLNINWCIYGVITTIWGELQSNNDNLNVLPFVVTKISFRDYIVYTIETLDNIWHL